MCACVRACVRACVCVGELSAHAHLTRQGLDAGAQGVVSPCGMHGRMHLRVACAEVRGADKLLLCTACMAQRGAGRGQQQEQQEH